MTPTALDIPPDRVALVRRVLALADELDRLALAAPDGTVLDACETAVLAGGRDLQRDMLHDAVARRVESAEKRGHRSAPATAADPRRTAAPRTGTSSPPSVT